MARTKRNEIQRLTLAAMLIALGIVLPTIFTPPVASRLLLMHIPALLAGFVIGPKYGFVVGFVTPLLRSVTFGMPPLVPAATAMAFEIATYGTVAGVMYNKLKPTIINTFISLITAMVLGRLAWGLAMYVIIVGFNQAGGIFTLSRWWTSVVATSITGIIIQLILIPAIMIALEKSGYIDKK